MTVKLPVAASPAFSLAAGSYTGARSVTISDTAPGATVYSTNDGSMPTTGSTVYSSPISVFATETVKAIATAPDFTVSAVGMAVNPGVKYFSGIGTYKKTIDAPAEWFKPGKKRVDVFLRHLR